MSEELNGFDGEMIDTEGAGETAVPKGQSKAAQAPSQSGQVIPAGPDNAVNLPSGQTIDSLDFDGRDLVIVLADGTRIVVPDGAIVVPQLIVDGIPIPPANVAALLVGNEPEPEAGVNPSSGGNFATDPGAIQSAFDLGDLLPYTELPQSVVVEEEIIPGLIEDEEPEVVIETPDNPVGVSEAIATVFEEGLPARGQPGEPEGTNAAGDGETTSGTIVFSSPDGLSAILINGEEITSIGQSFSSPIGTLTITSIDIPSGEVGFSYTLQDNTLAEEFDGFFEATVVDTDGDEASATLQIRVVDDAPIGTDDVGIDPVGNHDPITGNVLDNDISGADDFPVDGGVTGFSNASGSADPGATLQGTYGVLTLNEDGSYSYVRDVNTPGGVEEAFDYAIVDQDGSTSSAVLTIVIADGPTEITFVPEAGEGTVVNEAGLPTRDDEPAGTGEIADNDPANDSDPSETTSATVTFNSVDGLDNVSINGIPVDQGNLPQTIVSDDTGTLVITAVTYDPLTGDGSVTYEYTLGDNTDGDDTSVTFEISVTDLDGDTASDDLTITIVDDEPEALDDTGMAGSDENAPVTVDVFANDTSGADDVADDQIALADGSLVGGGSVIYNGDGTFTYTPAPGEEGDITFDYTITDGDGDVDTATVTITLADDSEPTIAVEGDDGVDEAGLPARSGEPEGSDAISDSEIAEGIIAITTGGDTLASLTVNGQDVTGGGTVVTAKGELEISVINGEYSYTYTLTDNTLTDPDSDTFTLVVTDSDGDTASTTLVMAIVDDSPSALDDAAGLAAGEYGPVGGLVLANDTQGADGATVTSYSGTGGSGGADTVVQGTYGTLTIAADGTFSYTRDPGTPGGVTDTFNYIITDGDGDQANADLVITIANSTTTLDLPTAGEDGTQVDEAGVESPFPGSAAAGDSEITSGVFTYTAPDGPAVVTIDGVAVTAVGQTFTGSFGTLTIDSIADGSIGYTYELTTNTNGDATTDGFAVVVTDQDGDFSDGTLEIAIVDDVPTANADSDSVTEDGPIIASGNVITGVDLAIPDANATDGVTDVQGADSAAVTGVVAGTSTGPVSGDVGATVAGSYGSITILSDGSYIYSLNNSDPVVQGLDADDALTDVFSYTLTDGDGDTSTTTVTVTVNGADDPVVLTGFNLQGAEQIVDEDDLSDGSSPDAAALTQSGTFDVTSVDGLATLTIDGTAIFGTGVIYPVVLTGDYGTLNITGVSTTIGADGDVVVATVSYDYVLSDNTEDHLLSGEDNVTDSFAVEATDTDGSSDTNSLDIDVTDDIPTANADTNSVGEGDSVTGNVLTDTADEFGADGAEAAGGVVGVRASGGDTTSDASGSVGVSIAGLYGTLTLAADGSYTYAASADVIAADQQDVFVYTIEDGDGDLSTTTLTIDVANVTLAPDNNTESVNEAALDLNQDGDDLAAGTVTGSDPASTAETVSGQLAVAGTGVTYALDSGSDTYGTLSLNADGSYTYTLTAPFDTSPDADDGPNTEAGAESYGYTATDVNGNTVTGTITVDIVDDVPVALAPDITTVTNTAGSMSLLTTLDTRDGDVDNDYGADGPGAVIFTAASISALDSQNLTSGLAPLTYTISTDGTVITAQKSTDSTDVFTIELQPTGGADQYKVTILQPIDSTQDIDFNDGGYDFVGGNASWAGFNLPGTADSQDLLLTPVGGGTVNTNANEGGIASGNSVGSGEAMRVDYVIDLVGSPVSGGDFYGGDDTQNFDGHYVINGGSAVFTRINSVSEIKVTAFDDDDSGTTKDVGDGTLDTITSIGISYNGASTVVSASGTVNVGGQVFNVTFNGDGSVNVGNMPEDTRIAVFTNDGFNSIEWEYVSGDTFKIGDFGATAITTDPVNFTVPISIRDGDGDVVDAGTLDITANPVVPPIVLDLDGGGNAFAPLSAGLAYDYNGDGVKTQTAWVAAGSAILAFDYNGDGLVTDASEFVFGGNGLTDLEAVAARYDANSDGILDANDAAYESFGVWLDSNLDAIADEGEFVSLSDAGITSIDLISDGIGYSDADGDVTISGTASFTMEDGSTGAVSDAAFATGADMSDGGAMMEALLILAESEADVPASIPRIVDEDIAGDAVSDALAGKIIDGLIDQFSGGGSSARSEIAEASTNDLSNLLSIEVGGPAMAFAPSLAELSMDEGGETAVIHG